MKHMKIADMLLAPEDEAQLTPQNAAAHSAMLTLMTMDDEESSKKVPCWLCMNDKLRYEARHALAELIKSLDASIEKATNNEKRLRALIKVKKKVEELSPTRLANWRRIERVMKHRRDAGDKAAYFFYGEKPTGLKS